MARERESTGREWKEKLQEFSCSLDYLEYPSGGGALNGKQVDQGILILEKN